MKQSRPPVVRMYLLDDQLRKNLYPNCSTLASYFEVHPKTIQRDVDYMRDLLGAPIDYHSRKKGFYYRENHDPRLLSRTLPSRPSRARGLKLDHELGSG
ncbi:hypothetical protein [Prosthecochloris sp. GSB1]|uniref:hypothetical protein n=1 Tax=Prosthecochloris sp. GSB1 TaxID=281093 RepID=UPI001F436F61|nr:hypothetical protein [Prosthecochloris sp. GSB1]